MPVEKATMTLRILWEDELRAAARLIRHMHDCPRDDEEEYIRRAQAALEACNFALYGADEEGAVVMMGSKEYHADRLSHGGRARG